MPIAPRRSARLAAKTAPKKPIDTWTCPNDGCVYPWTWNGTPYFRNFINQVWTQYDSTTVGDWAGQYDPKTNTIVTAAPEPTFDDDEY